MAPKAPTPTTTPRAVASTKKRTGPTKNSSSTKRKMSTTDLSPVHRDISPNELCSPPVSQEIVSYNQLSTRSRAYLKSSCAFPEKDFNLLINQLKSDLHQPSNIVGLIGPQKGKECFETWLVDYMNAGIGAVYWRADKGRIWDYSNDEDREKCVVILQKRYKKTWVALIP